MSSTVRLHVTRGADTGKSFEIENNQILVVGRGSSSQTRISDPEMSRVHFSVEYSGGRILISDLGSSSGTYVNGIKLTSPMDADTGDEIIAGATRMFVSLVGNIESDTMAPSRNSVLSELHNLVGTWMGDYFLKRIIGVGNTGLVFEAIDESKNRLAALKVFSKLFSQDACRRNQFVESAKVFCKIVDPHIVRLYQAGKNSNAYFYSAMQLVQGESLDSLIDRAGIEGMLDWKEVWKCAFQICGALVRTHEHNVLHRNLVPRNIMRRFRDEIYMLGDFAMATPIQPGTERWSGREYIGELNYLPPERIQDAKALIRDNLDNLSLGGTMDIRSDIFGLGATCYAMLTGKPPADGVDVPEVIASIRTQMPPLPTNSQMAVNEQFQSVIMKMIAKNPQDRFQTPKLLLKELSRIGRLNALDF